MTQIEYEKFLKSNFDNSESFRFLQAHKREYSIIINLNLDPAISVLESLYSPVRRARRRDPVCMLRALLLMVIMRVASITTWVKKMRGLSALAVLAGFDPDDTPGIGTYYDFMNRIIDGPYRKPYEHMVRRTCLNAGVHKRNLSSKKDAGKDPFNPHNSQSDRVAKELLTHEEDERADDFQKVLEDLFIRIGIIPSIEAGLIADLDDLIISGDGSIMASGASGNGKAACTCRSEGIYNCTHERCYTSPTARWCYSAHKDAFIFGDRYYHLTIHQGGHDFPLLTIIPGGNESDYTLSLKAIDRLRKAARENGLKIHVSAFCGDGHHDCYAHYDYFQKMGVVPIIPLSENGKTIIPHLANPDLRLDADGTPVCPGGKRMRHIMYNKRKRTHIFCCPAKKNTHRDGKSIYIFHPDECPMGGDCAPESTLKPIVYIKSSTDPRLYPPIPRDSKKFKELMNHRTSTERCNYLNDTYHLDRSCRNADYGLIRLTLVNIVEHAVIRYLDAAKSPPSGGILFTALNILKHETFSNASHAHADLKRLQAAEA